MLPAPHPADESTRIAALRLLDVLDTQPEERFDRLTRMAKRLFDVPIALVTLVDTDRQWFKSRAGMRSPQTSRDISFCGHAILSDDILLVPDARADNRFFDNPLVVGDPSIRFYAGCPLKVGAHSLGTLCVIDDKPREFGDEEQQLLRDLAEMAQQELAAIQMATTDHLTMISNRRGFEVLARHALSACKRTGTPATLLMFDLNRFKQINDVHGHAAGDRALKLFARGLVEVFREGDVVGRLGGDEFAVLLSNANPDAVAAALGRLSQWIRLNSDPDVHGYSIEFSAGRVDFSPGGSDSIENLLAIADLAMYESKRATRDLAQTQPRSSGKELASAVL